MASDRSGKSFPTSRCASTAASPADRTASTPRSPNAGGGAVRVHSHARTEDAEADQVWEHGQGRHGRPHLLCRCACWIRAPPTPGRPVGLARPSRRSGP